MAFDIANSLRPANFAGAYQAAQTQTVNNFLSKRQSDRADAELKMRQDADAQKQAEAKKQEVMSWLTNAVTSVRANPALIPQLVAEGKKRGVLDTNAPDTFTPEEVEKFALELGIAPPPKPQFKTISPGVAYGTVSDDGRFTQQDVVPTNKGSGSLSDKRWFVNEYMDTHPEATFDEAASAYQQYFNPMQPGVTDAGGVKYGYRRTPKGIVPQGAVVSLGETAGNAATIKGAEAEASTTETGLAERRLTAMGTDEAISEAEKLLAGRGSKKPTSSGTGAIADYVAGKVTGVALPGASEAGQLKVIGATLTAKVPRFKGADSEKDRQSYVEAAGQVGDATVPIAIRVAALKTVKALAAKAKQQNSGQSPTDDATDDVDALLDKYAPKSE